MLTWQERMELLDELAKYAPKMSDGDLVDTVAFVKISVKDNPRPDVPLTLVYPEPLAARR